MLENNAWDYGFYDDVEEYGGACLYDDIDCSCYGDSSSDFLDTDYCIYTDPIDINECFQYELNEFDINSVNGIPMVKMGGY